MKWGKRKSLGEGDDVDSPLRIDKESVLKALKDQIVRRMGGNYTLIISAEELNLKNIKQRFVRYMNEITREINQFEGVVNVRHFLEAELKCYHHMENTLEPLDDEMTVASLKKTMHWDDIKRVLTGLKEELYSKTDAYLVVNDAVFSTGIKDVELAYKAIKGIS